MIGAYALAWTLLTATAPLALVGLGLHDLLRRNRGASLRLLAMLWVFLLAELGGVTLALLIWIRHGLVPGRDSDRFLEDNYRLQRGWARVLLAAARGVVGLRFEVEGDDEAVPGPVLVLMRHTSIVDTILPVVFLGARHGLRLRYVLKTELRIDPCLDIVGERLPNCFVDRGGDTAQEMERVGRLADGLGRRDGVLIYPEGTRFTPARQARARERLAEQHPELYDRALRLRHVLPPRPGGTLALLEHGLPGADVVMVAHTGLERLVRMHDVLSGGLVGAVVRVRMWRIPGADVPDDREARVRWLFDRWAAVDAYVADFLRASSPPGLGSHPQADAEQ
ncbi:MAG: 1-acyl-sn-glycerol-3-phosphate acyltransferase [Myxococcales bacterium]|nr:1-acyl-sn-glycerol-3-phosphate acyltransferase [Myxococcales bacterium]MCB9715698.1 1-acyl-sn-glycerol-3-phosphate acyltransferase [Myxococcales bacterium]